MSGFFSGILVGALVALSFRDEAKHYRWLWKHEMKMRAFWHEEACKRGSELLAVATAKRKK